MKTYLTELLNIEHNRRAFSCGKLMLDNYLLYLSKQDIKQNLTCFVWNDPLANQIKGYYTLSNSDVPLESVIKSPRAKRSISTILLSRLAIDCHFQGMNIKKILLIDALKRSYELSKTIGSFAVVVDPIDNFARAFYEKYGFISLIDSGKMFLSMNTIEHLFS